MERLIYSTSTNHKTFFMFGKVEDHDLQIEIAFSGALIATRVIAPGMINELTKRFPRMTVNFQ